MEKLTEERLQNWIDDLETSLNFMSGAIARDCVKGVLAEMLELQKEVS